MSVLRLGRVDYSASCVCLVFQLIYLSHTNPERRVSGKLTWDFVVSQKSLDWKLKTSVSFEDMYKGKLAVLVYFNRASIVVLLVMGNFWPLVLGRVHACVLDSHAVTVNFAAIPWSFSRTVETGMLACTTHRVSWSTRRTRYASFT